MIQIPQRPVFWGPPNNCSSLKLAWNPRDDQHRNGKIEKGRRQSGINISSQYWVNDNNFLPCQVQRVEQTRLEQASKSLSRWVEVETVLATLLVSRRENLRDRSSRGNVRVAKLEPCSPGWLALLRNAREEGIRIGCQLSWRSHLSPPKDFRSGDSVRFVANKEVVECGRWHPLATLDPWWDWGHYLTLTGWPGFIYMHIPGSCRTTWVHVCSSIHSCLKWRNVIRGQFRNSHKLICSVGITFGASSFR